MNLDSRLIHDLGNSELAIQAFIFGDLLFLLVEGKHRNVNFLLEH